MNNFLDLTKEENQRFIASVICALCETESIDIGRFWEGEVSRLQYDLVAYVGSKSGTITFSLKPENGK